MILRERLLLEEDNFEDEVVDSADVDENNAGYAFEDALDDNIDTEETLVTNEISTPMTTYKVSFNLGSHNNWSRVDASSEEEAKQIVQDYITQKWPDRKYEFVEVEEFEEVQESLNEDINEEDPNKIFVNGELYQTFKKGTHFLDVDKVAYELKRMNGVKEVRVVYEDGGAFNMKVESLSESLTDAQPFETESAIGMSMVISDLIKDEYEAIDGYNSAIATAEAEGWGGLVKILTDIQAEEHIHIGQLQELLKSTDPNADKIIDGHLEAIYQQAGIKPELDV